MEAPNKKARKSEKKPEPASAEEIIDPSKTTDTEESEPLLKISRSDDEPILVGIGASAGGLEALRAMLSGLPAEANIAYVIAQHLDPSHHSLLTTLLARFTSLEVVAIEDNQEVKANQIFVTPPGKDVTLVQGRLQLRQPTAAIGPKPSIDQFFTSLAQDQGDKAVGVILSGTGSDGAHGIRAIKAEGGITIAQDESTAQYSSMPRAAIETGLVDLILPPEQIGPELIEIIKHPHVAALVVPESDPSDSLQVIFQMVLDKTGCDFSDYKPSTIRRRLDRRMVVHKLTRLEDYVRYLERSPTEIDLLFKDILISVTRFFRDPDTFQVLGETITKLVETKKPGDSIRIWVPGCATGEEVYSIAILLVETLGDRLNSISIQIFGTDIDVDAINRARKGVYPGAVIEGMDLALRERYFAGDHNTFQIRKSVREMVVFARQDLIRDPPFSHLDLVSCRNVLIYFNSTLQQRLMPIFHYVLRPGGYLFLGKSESIGPFDNLFIPVGRKEKIYRRRDTARAPEVHFGLARPVGLPLGPQRIKPVEKELRLKDVINQAIAEVYGYPAVIIDDRLEIVHVRGDISAYLTLAPGNTDLNILTMARSDIRVDLRALIHKTTREHTPTQSRRLTLPVGDQVKLVTIQVYPVSTNSGVTGLTLVLFEEEFTHEGPDLESIIASGEIDPRVAELERELRATKEHLHTTIEEVETANEELQSLNEELQSANEELQSSNEEFETANEELQSTNEELITVNEELQVKSNELAIATADLENVLDKIEINLVIVDRKLKITRLTPSVNRVFALTPDDLGRVLTTIPVHLDLPNLRADLLDVITQEKSIDREIETENVIYALRISPYYSEHGTVAGAVLRFLDLTKIKQTEKALKDAHDELEHRVTEHTAELTEVNHELRREIARREQAEQAGASGE
jgi:two-component system CheB/CheR fusion protein